MANAGKTLFAQFTKVRSIHCGFYKWKRMDADEKVYSKIGNWYRIFLSHICQSLYDVKPKAQLERYAPYCATGNLVPLINCQLLYEMHGAVALKGSHRMGDGRFFLKTSAPAPLSLMTTYWMSLISAISLDSTFMAVLFCRVKPTVMHCMQFFLYSM